MYALVPDELRAALKLFLPPERERPKCGRPRASDRVALDGINSVLRTGMQWRHLSRSEVDCSGKTS